MFDLFGKTINNVFLGANFKIVKNLVYILFLSVLFLMFSFSASGFKDIEENIYKEEILYLKNSGIVEGYGDGGYHPGENINRAEFLKILFEVVSVFGVIDGEIEGSNCYKDVHEEWFAPYVCNATELGFVKGYDDGYFRPEQSINFVEASKIIVNVMQFDVSERFIDTWFEKYVVVLESARAIPGEITNFDQKIKRGEMAFMIFQMMMFDGEELFSDNRNYKNIKLLSSLEGETKFMDFEGNDYIFYENNGDVYALINGVLRLIPEANSEYFYVFNSDLFKKYVYDHDYVFYGDNNYVYFIDVNDESVEPFILENIDPNTFELISGKYSFDYFNLGFLKDKNGVYFFNNKCLDCFTKLEEFESSVKIVDEFDSTVILEEQGIFYVTSIVEYSDFEIQPIEIPNIEYLDKAYFKDDQNVYFVTGAGYISNRDKFLNDLFYKKVEGLDSVSFSIVYPSNSNSLNFNEEYKYFLDQDEFVDDYIYPRFSAAIFCKDKNGFYYCDGSEAKIIEHARFDNIKLKEDNRAAYCREGYLKFDKHYLYDETYVWYYDSIVDNYVKIDDVNPDTFSLENYVDEKWANDECDLQGLGG